MAETKKTRGTRTRKSTPAGHTPMPTGPGSTCGHSGCGGACRVRYCGPTSHPRDHLIHQAAHGVKHVWTASIVAGLAVVLTGFMAYTAVQAESTPRVENLNDSVAALWRKLDQVERLVKELHDAQVADPALSQGSAAEDAETAQGATFDPATAANQLWPSP